MDNESNVSTAEQKLLDAIISDAQADAAKTFGNAESYYAETVKKAEDDAKKYVDAAISTAEKKAKEIVERKATLAALESRKTFLAAKQALVEEVFSRAEKLMEAMKEKDYLDFIEGLIKNNAEKGDVIVLSKNCPITEKQAEDLPAAKKLSLKAQKSGDFGGGIVLSGEKFDKDLTFRALCEMKKEASEAEIAEKLFG